MSSDDSPESDKRLLKNLQKPVPKKTQKKTRAQKSDSVDEKNILDLDDCDQELLKKNGLLAERLVAIEKILTMYPFLKKDRNMIINSILDKKEKLPDTYVLEKIPIKKKIYYLDPTGNIIDGNVKLVGFFVKNKNTVNSIMFTDIEKFADRLKNAVTIVSSLKTWAFI